MCGIMSALTGGTAESAAAAVEAAPEEEEPVGSLLDDLFRKTKVHAV